MPPSPKHEFLKAILDDFVALETGPQLPAARLAYWQGKMTTVKCPDLLGANLLRLAKRFRSTGALLAVRQIAALIVALLGRVAGTALLARDGMEMPRRNATSDAKVNAAERKALAGPKTARGGVGLRGTARPPRKPT